MLLFEFVWLIVSCVGFSEGLQVRWSGECYMSSLGTRKDSSPKKPFDAATMGVCSSTAPSCRWATRQNSAETMCQILNAQISCEVKFVCTIHVCWLPVAEYSNTSCLKYRHVCCMWNVMFLPSVWNKIRLKLKWRTYELVLVQKYVPFIWYCLINGRMQVFSFWKWYRIKLSPYAYFSWRLFWVTWPKWNKWHVLRE